MPWHSSWGHSQALSPLPQLVLLPFTPGCQDPKLQGAPSSVAKMTPTKMPGLPWLWRAGERGCSGAGLRELCLALYPSAAPMPWGPDPTFCWSKPLWAPGAGGDPQLGQERRDRISPCIATTQSVSPSSPSWMRGPRLPVPVSLKPMASMPITHQPIDAKSRPQ